jgi:hypothetical protein
MLSPAGTFSTLRICTCQSQWACSLRHEMSLPAQTLESWVRIPLEAWKYVYVFSVCVSCVHSVFAMGWSPIKGVLSTICKIHRNKLIPHANMYCSDCTKQSFSWLTNSHSANPYIFHLFTKLTGPLPYSQQPITTPSPKSEESSLYPQHSTPLRSILISSSYLGLGFLAFCYFLVF